jgi:hypothetical protein
MAHLEPYDAISAKSNLIMKLQRLQFARQHSRVLHEPRTGRHGSISSKTQSAPELSVLTAR